MTKDRRVELLSLTADADEGVVDQLVARLDSTRIRVRADASQASLALSLCNLLARIFPDVRLVSASSDVAVVPFGAGPLDLLGSRVIASVRPCEPRHSRASLTIDVGCAEPGSDLYVASDPWTVRISRSPIEIVQSTRSGPAMVAASALAAAEVFRAVLPEIGGVHLGPDPFCWNLLDYRLTEAPTQLDEARVEATCFGVGSVGSSLVYSLLIADACGEIELVDPDRITERNWLRYPLLLEQTQQPKASWAANASLGSRLIVEGHSMTAADFVNTLEAPPRLAVSSVDTVEGRRQIVDALAETTLNAGVQGLQLHVSRNRLGDGFACAYCSYVDVGSPVDETEMYVRLTGLSHERVRQLLAGATISRGDLHVMTSRGKLPATEGQDELVGVRLQDTLKNRLYAQALVSGGGSDFAVSAPFVSALAGSILAAELLKGDARHYYLRRRVDIDCTGYPTGFVTSPRANASGRCLCSDPIRVAAYRAAWEQQTT